jgi:hypothetical protein
VHGTFENTKNIVEFMMKTEIEILRDAIRSLKATGKDGFEGLLALALGRITKNPMRLAASGFQFGVDGQGEDRHNPVCFEAKRYKSKITRETVLTKIADLGRRNDEADILWILGATVEIPNQISQHLETDGLKQGVATLLLDWNDNGVSSLAATLANAGDDIGEWIGARATNGASAAGLTRILEVLRHKVEYKERWTSLSVQFSASEISTGNATVNNKAWMAETFENSTTARQRLGQPTAPGSSEIPVLPRKEIQDEIVSRLSSNPTAVIVGEEGRGKSWVAAQACLNFPGLAIIVGAEKFEGKSSDQIESLIIDELAKQCGDSERTAVRWEKRIRAWKTHPPKSPFVVVVDGINQRPDIKWVHVLTVLEGWLIDHGGKLIVTSRPAFFQRNVQSGFHPGRLINVQNWSAKERDEILRQKGIEQDWLDPTTKESLRNPRLLGIALSVLPAQKDDAWKGLNIERLLFEHILRMEKDQYEDEAPAELCLRLSADAQRVLDQIDSNSGEMPTPVFESETRAVAESRFFRAIPGPHGGYKLNDEGLSLALGFAVVDQLWRTKENGGDLDHTVSALLDPIAAVDASSPVVTAALYICAFDVQRFDSEIFKRLIDAFCNLQNLSDKAYPQFLDTLLKHPKVAFDAIKEGLLERRSKINTTWLSAVACDLFEREESKAIAEMAIFSWLRHVNIDALDQQGRYGRVDQKDLERAEKEQQRINDLIASFSEYERTQFADCVVVKGDVERLLILAMEMLARQPLAPWADSITQMGFAFSLDHCLHQSYKMIRQLTFFNTVDPVEAAAAFEVSVTPLRDEETSRTGRWTLVRMLLATGDEGRSKEAKAIADELNADRENHHFESQLEKYCASDPCDPGSARPDNVAKTIEKYKHIDVMKLYSNMGHSQQDWFRDDALCAVSRFGSEVAAAKNRELAETIVNREKMHLRQLALNGTAVIPLMTATSSAALAARLKSDKHLDGLPDNDRRVVSMYMLRFCMDHLNGNEQLNLLTNDVGKGDYPLDAIPSLKRPDENRVISVLDKAYQANDADAAFGALAMISHTFDHMSPVLEANVEKFREWENELVRGAVFEVALQMDSTMLRENHVHSAWTSESADDQRTYEAWNGSCLLIEAAKKQQIGMSEMLARISPKALYHAAHSLGAPISNLILHIIDNRLLSASIVSDNLALPPIETTVSQHDLVNFSFMSPDDRNKEQLSGSDAFKSAISDTTEDFNKRQARLRQQQYDLELELAKKDVEFLLETIDINVLSELISGGSDFADRWADLLLGLSDRQFYWFKGFALALARAIVGADEAKALLLFGRATASDAFVKQVYMDGLSLEQKAIWSCPQTSALTDVWKQRLKQCSDDARLASEVLAAERFGASEFIVKEVEALLASNRPVDRSLGITIAGFSNQLEKMAEHVVGLVDSPSYFGDSSLVALRAHQRAIWSKHWVELMWNAKTPEEFWINFNLAVKIIDARESYTNGIFRDENHWKKFATIFTTARKKRMGVWSKERAKTLFGVEKPEPCFAPYKNA